MPIYISISESKNKVFERKMKIETLYFSVKYFISCRLNSRILLLVATHSNIILQFSSYLKHFVVLEHNTSEKYWIVFVGVGKQCALNISCDYGVPVEILVGTLYPLQITLAHCTFYSSRVYNVLVKIALCRLYLLQLPWVRCKFYISPRYAVFTTRLFGYIELSFLVLED